MSSKATYKCDECGNLQEELKLTRWECENCGTTNICGTKVVEIVEKDREIESEMELLVYLAFGKQKTQKEAVEMIYKKNYQDVNIKPFANARDSLVEKDMLEVVEAGRNQVLEAKDTVYDLEEVKETRWFREGDNRIELDRTLMFDKILGEIL